MKFEEMPVEVQKLFSEPYWGDVLYRPALVSYPQPYIRFADILAFGPFTYLEYLSPQKPRSADISSLYGYGYGFAGLQNPLIMLRPLYDTSEAIASLHAPELPPYDPDMEFYLTNGHELAVVSLRVFEILEANNAVFPNMWRDICVADSAEDSPEETSFRLIDFPRFPVIDYQRSHSNWRKSEQRSGAPPIYYGFPHTAPGKFATNDLSGAPSIVREKHSPGIFIRTTLLQLLKAGSVKGPDYSVLDFKIES